MAALSCQVRNLHTVLLGAPGDQRRGINPVPRGWLGSEGGVQHGKDIKARNVGRIKWNHVWNSKAWSAERALPESPRSLRWLVHSSTRPQKPKPSTVGPTGGHAHIPSGELGEGFMEEWHLSWALKDSEDPGSNFQLSLCSSGT